MKKPLKILTFITLCFIFFCGCTKTKNLDSIDDPISHDDSGGPTDPQPVDPTNPPLSILDTPIPGPYMQNSEVGAEDSFSDEDKIVATYYFYWYSYPTKAHFLNGDGSDALTSHPANPELTDYNSVGWHRSELLDMIDAGIDVLLPVYWGDTRNLSWSVEGLKKLAIAWQELKAEGYDPPLIGMFFDTTPLMSESELKNPDEKFDLIRIEGKEYFYKMIRDFYSLIPSKARARVNNKPIVWLYSAAFAENFDNSLFDYARVHFFNDFGGDGLFIVKEISWRNLESEGLYQWGAALNGLNSFTNVISIGPGYDDSAVPDRNTPKRDRENGKFFENSWNDAISLNAINPDFHIVVVETWNEFHEGTDIADSKEYGRKYININREKSDIFKSGNYEIPDSLKRETVYFDLDDGNDGDIQFLENGDGKAEIVEINGKKCLKPIKTEHNSQYLYFKVDPFFKMMYKERIFKLKIEYLDNANSGFKVDYDSKDGTTALDGAYKRIPQVIQTTNTGEFKEVEFSLNDWLFKNRENAGADFRIEAKNLDLMISSISITVE